MAAIAVTDTLSLDDRAISESFVRASGPGGQNVNKLSTAVELRVVLAETGLPQPVLARLARLAGRRLSQAGVLVITAQRHRTQERNRDAAMATLLDLVRAAAIPPRRRVPTRPGKAARERRLTEKARQGQVKRQRARPPPDS
ncbi:MAG: aminoacyl-tRNA hydrolase [Rhodospirillales bacterium]|jgi:ribosome-associated protein|nr:aminoacyl-tRNA hydrolase [Rhodospirillales bacterium]